MPYAMFKVDTIATDAGTTQWLDSMLVKINKPNRVVEISRNNYYQSPKVKGIPDLIGGDSAFVAGLRNDRTKAMFDNDAKWPGMVWDDATITEVDPGFINNPTDEDKLVSVGLLTYRTSIDTGNIIYDKDGDFLTFEWPIWGAGGFVDFAYTNTELNKASDLGLPLGDLYHWYPAKYDCWMKGGVDCASAVNEVSGVSSIGSYPNPFTGSVTISYNLDKASNVKLVVYDVLGQQVATIANEIKPAGMHNDTWTPSNIPAGVYFYNIEINNQATQSQRMVYMK
jgi:hypothetical protein